MVYVDFLRGLVNGGLVWYSISGFRVSGDWFVNSGVVGLLLAQVCVSVTVGLIGMLWV